MPRFFCDNITNNIATITSNDAHHIAGVLRLSIGDSLTLCDGCGTDYDCVITHCTDSEVTLNVNARSPSVTEASVTIHLFQCVPKQEKLEIIVQKAVELGCVGITPVHSTFCVSKISEEKSDKKSERLRKIALSAAKQSGRGIIPNVNKPLNFSQMIKKLTEYDLCICCYEHGGVSLDKIIAPNIGSIALIIGSEGGFSKDEIALLEQNNVQIASLGPRILRCETAPLAAISIIMNLTGNM